MQQSVCTYKKLGEDGYEAKWETSCSHQLTIESPTDVGWSFAPLPTDGGRKYCPFCGGQITILKDKPNA